VHNDNITALIGVSMGAQRVVGGRQWIHGGGG
jgi:hypothetical protein